MNEDEIINKLKGDIDFSINIGIIANLNAIEKVLLINGITTTDELTELVEETEKSLYKEAANREIERNKAFDEVINKLMGLGGEKDDNNKSR